MPHFLRFALWNANGLTQHVDKLKTFISHYDIDVMLISETHFKDKSHLKLPNYTAYHTNHPAGTARGGSAILLKNSIQPSQATTVSVEDTIGPSTISAIFHPNTSSLQISSAPLGHDSLPAVTTMQSTLTGDPASLRREGEKSSKLWKVNSCTISHRCTYLLAF
jgi:exonuclease III